jgi:hypothetical protein
MATSGPITYLVMADQFLSVAAGHKRLPQTTAMSSPLIGTHKGSRCQEGIRIRPADYARRHPVKDLAAPGRFLLIAGEDGHAWCEAARQLAAEADVPLDALRIGHLDGDYHDPRCAWQRHRQIASDGAIVVRPDRFVAWRYPAAASDPRAVLTAALSQILGRRSFAQPGSAGS